MCGMKAYILIHFVYLDVFACARWAWDLMLIVGPLRNQLSCMVNKSVLIGSALQRLRYQNLIKSLFQSCLVARTKLCSVAMDTREVTKYQTWKHSTGLWFSSGYIWIWCHVHSLQCFDRLPQYLITKAVNTQLRHLKEATFPFSPTSESHRAECMLLMHGAPVRSLPLMLLHRETGGDGERKKQLSVLACWSYQASEWSLKTKAWLAYKWVYLVWKKLPLVVLFTKKNCMQMVTFLPLTESVSISLLCRYTVVANVFTIVSSPKPHYQWLTGRELISDIWCFQVQWIRRLWWSALETIMPPSWSDSFSSKTITWNKRLLRVITTFNEVALVKCMLT